MGRRKPVLKADAHAIAVALRKAARAERYESSTESNHRESGPGNGLCAQCGSSWPCVTERRAAKLEAMARGLSAAMVVYSGGR